MLPETGAIGRYLITRRVAHGGMGTLYLAQDPVLGRPVGLKLFLQDLDQPEAHERFAREARAAATLSHPHIVTIYDYGEYESQPYMVMEFIQGETLAGLIRRRADVHILTKLRWMEELCAAVEYAHAHGVIHRDLKPLNLMVDTNGRLKVLDFGIARMRGSLASHATARIGTAGYMAPEQIRGGNIDHRSDLFSIGVVSYELISYVEPFAAPVDAAITNRILEDEPTPLQEIDPAIEPQLADLVWKALRKDPAGRFQDADSMRLAFVAVRRRLETATTAESTLPPPLILAPEGGAVNKPPTKGRPQGGDVSSAAAAAAEKRAERGALVRERTAQIQASLLLARQLLEAGHLPAARAECVRVLGLDNAQPEALELARRIDLETARGEVAAMVRRGFEELQQGSVTKAVEFLDRARGLIPDDPEAGRLDRALRIARAQQDVDRRRADRFRGAVRAAEDALDGGLLEAALGHAREALEIDPKSEQALALETEALRRIDNDTGPPSEVRTAPRFPGPMDPTVIMTPPVHRSGAVPVAAPTTAKAPMPISGRAKAAAPSRFAAALTRLPGQWRRASRRQRALLVSGLAALSTLAVVVLVLTARPQKTQRPPSPPAPSPVLVVIDAVPWAIVKEVAREGGVAQQVPENAYTPLALSLLPGLYHVRLEGPPGTQSEDNYPYDVKAGAVFPPVQFKQLDAMTFDKYFKDYVKSKPPAAAPGGRK